MDTTTSIVGTSIVVTIGRWADEKQLDMRMFVGLAFVAIFLSIMENSNAKLAQQFGSLILISAILIYAIPISNKVKGTTSAKKTPAKSGPDNPFGGF